VSRAAIGRFAPIADWLPRYERSMLRGDVLAGIAVAAMIVPKDLGYAGIAGIPLQNGLYAAAAGAIVYALFCTSRHISTGPSSSLAAVAGGAVLVVGVEGPQAAELVAAITLVTGALFLLLAVLRLGWIARFLSRAVVTGFRQFRQRPTSKCSPEVSSSKAREVRHGPQIPSTSSERLLSCPHRLHGAGSGER